MQKKRNAFRVAFVRQEGNMVGIGKNDNISWQLGGSVCFIHAGGKRLRVATEENRLVGNAAEINVRVGPTDTRILLSVFPDIRIHHTFEIISVSPESAPNHIRTYAFPIGGEASGMIGASVARPAGGFSTRAT